MRDGFDQSFVTQYLDGPTCGVPRYSEQADEILL
jgi:hypothetical protein